MTSSLGSNRASPLVCLFTVTMDIEAPLRLKQAVADLEMTIKKLSEDLKEKESLLEHFMELAYGSSPSTSAHCLRFRTPWSGTLAPVPGLRPVQLHATATDLPGLKW